MRDAQWHLGFLHVAEAHTYSQGEGIVVGVVDTGVDASHPDLAGNVLAGRDFTGTGEDGRADVNGHGTAMAGLIVAHGRALGIAPKSKVLPLRDTIDGLLGTASTAIEWGIDNGVKVLSLSFVAADTFDLKQAIERAIANDIVVVAGVGNRTQFSSLDFPAGYPGVIGAAGLDKDGSHASISKASRFADLAAPAVDIWSTNTLANGGADYRAGSGTSDATAIVAGAAALVRAKYPHLSAAEVVNRLIATADDRGAPGRDDEYGYGVINLVNALTADVPLLTPTATPPPATRHRHRPVAAASPPVPSS